MAKTKLTKIQMKFCEEYIKDYKLSRYICCLIVQNTDPKKEFDGLEKYYK